MAPERAPYPGIKGEKMENTRIKYWLRRLHFFKNGCCNIQKNIINVAFAILCVMSRLFYSGSQVK